ncbi:MAG: potassium channel family protein [Methanoculleaceae archaeon]
MITGVFTVLLVIPIVLAPYLSRYIQANPPDRLPFHPRGHIIIAGSNELSAAMVESLRISTTPVVLIEEDKERARQAAGRFRGAAWVIWGPFSDKETWRRAYFQDARTVIICTPERVGAVIALTIREETGARIIAVVDDLSYSPYLRYAGVEYVLSPKNSTGKILARHTVLRPEVDTIYEAISMDRMSFDTAGGGSSLKLVKIPVLQGSPVVNRTLRDLALPERFGIFVVVLWKRGEFVLHPSPDDPLDTSVMLIVLGRSADIARALPEFQPPAKGDTFAVIAGYGDVGRGAREELDDAGIPSVVIDPTLSGPGIVTGRSESPEILAAAGIADARYCIVAVNDDDVNIFTALLARNQNPAIRILARANEPAAVEKLYRAGADYVALLPTIGGQVIAGVILADTVRVLLDLPSGQKVVMRRVQHHLPTTIGRIEKRTHVRVLGIEPREGVPVVSPSPDVTVREGDSLIVIGGNRAIMRFVKRF